MGASTTGFLITASWLTILTAVPALAADLTVAERWPDVAATTTEGLPAVSGINGKLLIYGGVAEDDGVVIGEGSLSVPLGHAYGLQVDGGVGTRDDDTVLHGGAHLFWRDPAVGLLGVYASYNSLGGDRFNRYALEAHHYSGSWTFEGFAGWDDGEDDDGFFGLAEFSKYVHDDFRVTAGIGHSDWVSGVYSGPGLIGTAGFEWQTNWLGPQHAQSIFAQGQFGDDYSSIMGGVKIYLGGEPKSLIRRHREDDPPLVDVGATRTESTIVPTESTEIVPDEGEVP